MILVLDVMAVVVVVVVEVFVLVLVSVGVVAVVVAAVGVAVVTEAVVVVGERGHPAAAGRSVCVSLFFPWIHRPGSHEVEYVQVC